VTEPSVEQENPNKTISKDFTGKFGGATRDETNVGSPEKCDTKLNSGASEEKGSA